LPSEVLPDRAIRNAVSLHRQGNLTAAEQLYCSILTTHPHHFEALHLLGVLRLQQNRPVDALPLFDQALAIDPNSGEVLANSAAALMALGRPADALKRLDALQMLNPADAETLYNKGVVLAALDRREEAIGAYRMAIAIRPDHLPAMFNLGNEHAAGTRFVEALAVFDKALALAPDHVDVLINSANVLAKLDRSEAALERFDRVLALQPSHLVALTNRANVLKQLRRYDLALADYDRVLAADPGNAAALFNRGNALIDIGLNSDAVECLRRAVALRPNVADIHASYANALFDSRRPAEAVAEFRRVLALAPNDSDAHSNLIFALNFDASATAADHQAERLRFGQRYDYLQSAAGDHANVPDPDRRLRIGYVSAHFRSQAATFSFGGVIVGHDPKQFEIVCFSDTKEEDAITERLRSVAKAWHATGALSHEQLADLIRAEHIDILVDLVGHMRGYRLPAFARQPAPVQVTAWGEPTGTGVRAIDYLFADPVLVPDSERSLLTERVIDLPNFLGYWTPEALPEPGPLPARARGYVTFGSFNRLTKVLEPVLRAWAEIMRAVPNSRLLLKDGLFDRDSYEAPILATLAAEGIAAERISVLNKMDRAAHFAAYQDVDIALDPFPHGGGMTTLDALSMGVPVITTPGRTISSRLAAATLTSLDLSEYIAADLASYVALAAEMARDLDRLARARGMLRLRLANSQLGDPARYARAVEAAYRKIWRSWCVSRSGAA
jgi:predicted O-linked N-acetylglucosamine transferase (SPINDLY family)